MKTKKTENREPLSSTSKTRTVQVYLYVRTYVRTQKKGVTKYVEWQYTMYVVLSQKLC